MLVTDTQKVRALRAAFRGAMQPPPSLTVDEWAEQHLVLSDRNSPVPGPIRLDLTPYLRAPLRAFTDPHVERIAFCGATQTGKTTLLFACLGFCIDHDPGPAMMLYPTQETAKSVSKDRLQPMIQDCPSLVRHLTGIHDDFQLLAYTFDRMTIRFAWAQGQATVRSRPIRYLFKDETTAAVSKAWSEADNRTKAYFNRRIFEVSTPKLDNDPMWTFCGLSRREDAKEPNPMSSAAWEPTSATTVNWYLVPCPHCGARFRFEFDGLRWPPDCAIRDLDAAGWYECPHCHKPIYDRHKPEMLRRGTWVSPNPGGRWVAFHMNSIYAPWDSCRFGAIASLYVRAKLRHDPEVMAEFVNNYLALPYNFQEAGATLVTDAAVELAGTGTGYQRNQIPAEVRVLTLGADVRETQVHYVVQGWGPGGHSWRISWGILQDLAELERLVQKNTWHHPAGVQMRIAAGAVDCRYRRHDVIEMCRRLRIIRAVQGEARLQEPGVAGQLPWKTTLLDRDTKGKPLAGSLVGYRVNSLYWKEYIYSRINEAQTPSEPEAAKTAPTPKWHMPEDRDEEYSRHMQSEQEVYRRKRGSGELVRVWVTRPGFEANHYLDCEVYACAMAHVLKLLAMPPTHPIVQGQAAPAAPTGNRPAPFVDPSRINLGKR